MQSNTGSKITTQDSPSKPEKSALGSQQAKPTQKARSVRLPPSARFVLKTLEEHGELCFSDLLTQTNLPHRNLCSALKELRRNRLIRVRRCLGDARRRLYCYSVNHDSGVSSGKPSTLVDHA